MTKKSIKVQIPEGTDATPIAVLVQVASQYESQIYVECGEKKVNAKSIMGMMSLILHRGEEIVVTADGADEDKAISGIEEYLSSTK